MKDKPQPTWENLLQLFQQHIEDTVERIVEERMKAQQEPAGAIEKEFVTLLELSDKTAVPLTTLKRHVKAKKLLVHRPTPILVLVAKEEVARYISLLKAC
jgi:hypothetical protein